MTVPGVARLETGDEGLDGDLSFAFESVTHPPAWFVGLVQAFPDRALPSGFEYSVVDGLPADGEHRDGDEVKVIRVVDGPGQEVETVPEGQRGDVGASVLQDVEGLEPEAVLGQGLEAESLFGAGGQNRRRGLEGCRAMVRPVSSVVPGKTSSPSRMVPSRPESPVVRWGRLSWNSPRR